MNSCYILWWYVSSTVCIFLSHFLGVSYLLGPQLLVTWIVNISPICHLPFTLLHFGYEETYLKDKTYSYFMFCGDVSGSGSFNLSNLYSNHLIQKTWPPSHVEFYSVNLWGGFLSQLTTAILILSFNQIVYKDKHSLQRQTFLHKFWGQFREETLLTETGSSFQSGVDAHVCYGAFWSTRSTCAEVHIYL